MDEIHLTKKDFKIDWYSGQGAGGQRRNKVMACCRITHIESGLTVNGTKHAHRVANQKDAFEKLARMVISYYSEDTGKERRTTSEVIRTYHEPRNEVHDKASGLKKTYKEIVLDAKIDEMITARKTAKGGS